MIRWLAENPVISIQFVLHDIAQSNLSKQKMQSQLHLIWKEKEEKAVKDSFHAYKSLFLYIISVAFELGQRGK